MADIKIKQSIGERILTHFVIHGIMYCIWFVIIGLGMAAVHTLVVAGTENRNAKEAVLIESCGGAANVAEVDGDLRYGVCIDGTTIDIRSRTNAKQLRSKHGVEQ